MDLGRLHLIATHERENVLFDPASLTILTGDLTSERLCQNDLTDTFAAWRANAPAPEIACSTPDSVPTARPRLRRLTLHIASTCNLACRYCYANGGHYGLAQGLLSGERAAELVGEALRLWDVETLMFFGGEPSLNPDAMAAVCLLVTELHDRGLITTLPRFAVISNLAGQGETFDSFLGLCQLLDIHITASVDGPAQVHDANRVDRTGRGSYAQVRDNFNRVRDLGLPLGIECTYTPQHLAQGISILDLMRFFDREFGLSQTHIAPMMGRDGVALPTLLEQYGAVIQAMLTPDSADAHLSVSLVQRQLNALATREPIAHYCPAGHAELAIGPDGLVYPCFMFAGQARFQMGAMDADAWPWPQGARILREIEAHDKASHPLCRDCWVRGLCSGCIGGDYFESGDLAVKPRCALTQGIAAEAIMRLAESSQGKPLGYYSRAQRLNAL